ncbi:MAG: hypothetical protein JO342_16060 [Solirubrobacterales bacterium]|nr:hypothetical protein [Solirubrobacterales bacterium]
MAADKRDDSTKQSDEGKRERPRASERLEQYGFGENLPDGDETVAEREYEDYVLAERDSDSEEPDVLLDVPVVKVDEINFNVEQLRARVSLQAEVLDLVRLNVGADVFIGHVELEIKGVEAQALLKVRLDNIARILDRVLTTIDRNPQIIEQISAGVRSAVEDVGGGAGKAVGELGEGAGSAVEDVGKGAGSAVEDVGEGAGSAVEDVGEGAGSAVEDVGEGAGSAVEDVGEGAGSAVEDVGEGAGSTVEETGETARRTAQGARKTASQATSRGGKLAKDAKGTAQKDAERHAAKRPGASGGRRRVKRSSGGTGASDDRPPRS